RPRPVEAEALRVPFPQIERDGAAARPRAEAPPSLGQTETSGAEADPRLVQGHERVRSQARLGDPRCRSRRRRGENAVRGVSKDNGAEREVALQIKQDLVQGYSVPQMLDEFLHDAEFLALTTGELGPALAAPAERRRDHP